MIPSNCLTSDCKASCQIPVLLINVMIHEMQADAIA